MKNYVIGIDGGGTKAHLCAADMDGNMLYECFGGGTNLCSSGYDRVKDVLTGILTSCKTALNGEEPLAVCIGSGGVVGNESSGRLKNIISENVNTKNIFVFNDAFIALRSHLGDGAGISVTAGTGTICLAQDGKGKSLRLSGWGHIFSDEGSAYYIAKKGLEKVCLAHDGRIPETLMTELFIKELNAENFDDLISKIYAGYQEKGSLASLAKIVDEAARSNDVAAADVLSDAAMQLYEICSFAAERLFKNGEKFSVVKNGSVLNRNAFVSRRFDELMGASYPDCTIRSGERAAVWGAVDYAIQAVGNK